MPSAGFLADGSNVSTININDTQSTINVSELDSVNPMDINSIQNITNMLLPADSMFKGENNIENYAPNSATPSYVPTQPSFRVVGTAKNSITLDAKFPINGQYGNSIQYYNYQTQPWTLFNNTYYLRNGIHSLSNLR